MHKLPNIFDDLDVPGIVVDCSDHQAKRFGAFTEDAITMEDAHLSAEIEKRREIVEQVDAVHRLEGFKPEEAPDWFKELTEDYVLGNVSAEEATQKALELINVR